MTPLAELAPRDAPPPPGTRVVIDARPLQEPDRTPITAAYLQRLLTAYAARPLAGESFVTLLRTLGDDPTERYEALGLPVAARRRLPATGRLLGSAGLTLDSFLLRAAEVGTGFRAREAGALGAVYHTAGGAVPLKSRMPVVATVLDLAPWELPELYARSPAARFGHRLRARVLVEATRVIVASRATGETVRRLLHVRPERIAIIPLASDDAFGPWAAGSTELASLRTRLGIPARYLVFAGNYDARKDFSVLFEALAGLCEEGPDRPASSLDPWPPRIVLAGGARGGDEPSPLRALIERHGVGDVVHVTPRLSADELALLESGARAFVFPVRTEATALPVHDALAVGLPVVASNTGPLAELVGNAGILVEPRDATRLAAALRAIWSDDRIHAGLARIAQERARGRRRTWHDVARETRAVYASAVGDGASDAGAGGW